jgi:hypothetical protein
MCLILFAALDLFSMQTVAGSIELSVIGMLNTWPTFITGINSDSLHTIIIGVVRGIPQSVILYAIVFYISKSLSNLFVRAPYVRTTALIVK